MMTLIGCSGNQQIDPDADGIDEQDEIKTDHAKEIGENNIKDIVTIEDKTFDEEDLNFYTLMNKIKIILQIDATDDEDEKNYYREQLNYYDFTNANLQSLIELYSITLLAEEKNYFVPDEKLEKALEKYEDQIQNVPEAVDLIETFGKETYKRKLKEYVRQSMLRERVVNELKEDIEADNPDADELEINYTLEKYFDDLLMDQIASLDLEIHLQ